MKLISRPVSLKEITELNSKYGPYMKVTVDIEKGILVCGCELHADGEQILLQQGNLQDNIWGGGIDMTMKTVDATAVLNLRPRLNNDSMEILDPKKRDKFFQVVKTLFEPLWKT